MSYLRALLFVVLSVFASCSFAKHLGERGFKGDWTEEFHLKGGGIAVHAPDHVRIGNMWAGNRIRITVGKFPILVLNTDSSRKEFVRALCDAGFYDKCAV